MTWCQSSVVGGVLGWVSLCVCVCVSVSLCVCRMGYRCWVCPACNHAYCVMYAWLCHHERELFGRISGGIMVNVRIVSVRHYVLLWLGKQHCECGVRTVCVTVVCVGNLRVCGCVPVVVG